MCTVPTSKLFAPLIIAAPPTRRDCVGDDPQGQVGPLRWVP